MSFMVYPALDIRAGQVVRLRQGDYACETRYGDDALARCQGFLAAGARWMHLVDLDAARAGGYTLLPLLKSMVATGMKLQTGGGVRCREDVARLLAAGASRVVIGSLAVREPEQVMRWLQEFGADRITVALDTRQDHDQVWRLPVHGWTETAEATLDEWVHRYSQAGLQHLLCTDISRDGMLSGPNLPLYAHLRQLAPGLQIQVSGGARSLADVRAAKQAGCAGIVLGKALLEGQLNLQEALSC